MTLPQLIGLSGYAQTGKDTVGQILHDLYAFERVAFADKLKALALASNPNVGLVWQEHGKELRDPPISTLQECVDWDGWEGAKRLPAVRRYLQNLGVAAREVFGPDFWVDQALKPPFSSRIVVTDVRFPNEWEAIKDYGGKVWRIDRPGVESVNAHISETALDAYSFDVRLYNESTISDLSLKVINALTPIPWSEKNLSEALNDIMDSSVFKR